RLNVKLPGTPSGPKATPNGLYTLSAGTLILELMGSRPITGEGANPPMLSVLAKRNWPKNCTCFPNKSYSPLAKACFRSCDRIEAWPGNSAVLSRPAVLNAPGKATYGPSPLPSGATYWSDPRAGSVAYALYLSTAPGPVKVGAPG